MSEPEFDLFRDLLKISAGDPKPAFDGFARFHAYVDETVGRAHSPGHGDAAVAITAPEPEPKFRTPAF